MTSILPIIVGIVLNLIPADSSTFTMQMKEGDKTGTVQFTKQADGGWKAVRQGVGKDSLGVFYLDGTKVTRKGPDKKETQDLAKVLGVDENTKWKNLKKVTIGSIPVNLEHKARGVDFMFKERTIRVRWKAKK